MRGETRQQGATFFVQRKTTPPTLTGGVHDLDLTLHVLALRHECRSVGRGLLLPFSVLCQALQPDHPKIIAVTRTNAQPVSHSGKPIRSKIGDRNERLKLGSQPLS